MSYSLAIFKYSILLILVLFINTNYALSQSMESRLGDATVTPTSAAKVESYGMNINVGNPGPDPASFGTRHHRLGNEGGIGSSFIHTTSATAESQPVSRYVSPTPNTLPSTAPAIPISGIFKKASYFSPQMLYIQTPSPEAAEQGYHSVELEKTNTLPYDIFWGHQKPWGYTQPSLGAFRGAELLPSTP